MNTNNVVYTKQKYQKVNTLNKLLLDDYIIELKSKRRKPSTLKQYLSDGRMILCYIYENLDNKSMLYLTKKDLRQISLWFLATRKVSNARYNRVFALIRGILEYAEDEEYYDYDRNIARKIKGLEKNPVKDIIFLEDTHIQLLRDYLVSHKMYRECTYLDLSYDSAARIGEILQVNKEDLLNKRYTNIVTGKGGKQFRLVYHLNTLLSLKLYLENLENNNINNLWVGYNNSGHIKAVNNYGTLYEWCVKFRKILYSITNKYLKITPHSFRHSSLENYKNGSHYMCIKLNKPNGFNIEELQILAHHDNVDTTNQYLKPNDTNILENMFNISLD